MQLHKLVLPQPFFFPGELLEYYSIQTDSMPIISKNTNKSKKI